jgi:hypothetical protein
MRWYARPEGDNHQLRVEPRLESWNKASDPDQVRLRAFLDDTEALLAASRIDGPWALRLDVGLPTGRDLLDMADPYNYAYPLASRLKDAGLTSVWCTKQHSQQVKWLKGIEFLAHYSEIGSGYGGYSEDHKFFARHQTI